MSFKVVSYCLTQKKLTFPASSDTRAPLRPSVWIQPGDDSPALCERDHAQSQQQESQVGAFMCPTRACLLYPSVSFVSNPSYAAAAGPKPSCWSCWPPCVSSEADMTSSSLLLTTSRMWEELLYWGSWHICNCFRLVTVARSVMPLFQTSPIWWLILWQTQSTRHMRCDRSFSTCRTVMGVTSKSKNSPRVKSIS